jgi:hypothetical protein
MRYLFIPVLAQTIYPFFALPQAVQGVLMPYELLLWEVQLCNVRRTKDRILQGYTPLKNIHLAESVEQILADVFV